MAKWYNAHKKIGQVGGSVFYIDKGQTIERSKAAVIHNPRTRSQQTQRVKWANLVHFWGSCSHAFDRGFIAKKPRQTWYNAFMSANLYSEPINFTKEFADMKCAVVAPYIIASGRLPSLGFEKVTSHLLKSSIMVGSQPISTLGNLSQRIITNNSDWINGDKICVLAFFQKANSLNYPYIELYKDSLTLDINSDAAIDNWQVQGLNYLTYELPVNLDTYYLAGIALVHTRSVDNGIIVSTQEVVMTSDYYLNFVGDAALERALASYNVTDNSFYVPDVPSPQP